MFETKKKRSSEVSRAEKSGSNLIAPFLCEVAEDEKEDLLNDTLRASLAKKTTHRKVKKTLEVCRLGDAEETRRSPDNSKVTSRNLARKF